MKRSYSASRNVAGQWRIWITENGVERDLCGAETEAVAWATCAILNAMRQSGVVP